ncbi:MAG: hypothetical protein ACHBNF_15320 [Chromatiales bacterium]
MYLDEEVRASPTRPTPDVDLSELVNEMLKKEIEIIEAAGNKGVTP